MWHIKSSINNLLAIRSQIGSLHGSDELCVLLYSLAKREKPATVIELGTGLGVTSVWIAAAMQENGHGLLYTYDNGSHYQKPGVQDFIANLDGPLRELAGRADSSAYSDFMEEVFRFAGVNRHVRFRETDIALDGSTTDKDLGDEKIGWLFSDFNHSPETLQRLLRTYLPRMESCGSIFFDSASTFLPSFYTLERLVDMLNTNKLPTALVEGIDDRGAERLAAFICRHRFRLMHLVEKAERAQNSTAWIKIEPCDVVPAGATYLR